ncbi:hypothetical protein T08_6100 [Trichinella sp. T8]|nr:hypothetical protein T08_6100 [Trichinella sp. T8]
MDNKGVFLLGPTFLLLVFAHAILLDRQIFVVLVFILLGREVFVVLNPAGTFIWGPEKTDVLSGKT